MQEMVRLMMDYFGVDQGQAAEALVAVACVGGAALICRWVGLSAVATARIVSKVGSAVIACRKTKEVDPLCGEILKQLDDEVAMLNDSSWENIRLEAGTLQITHADCVKPTVLVNGRDVFPDLNSSEQKQVRRKLLATVERVRERDRLMRRAESLAKLTHAESNYSATISKNSPLRKLA